MTKSKIFDSKSKILLKIYFYICIQMNEIPKHHGEFEFIIDRLIYLRKEFKITQKQLAITLNSKQESISYLERKLNFGFLVMKVVLYFIEKHNVNPQWIFIRENDEIIKYTNIPEFSFSSKSLSQINLIKDFKNLEQEQLQVIKKLHICITRITNL